MKTIVHGDAAAVVWLNPDSRRNSAVLIWACWCWKHPWRNWNRSRLYLHNNTPETNHYKNPISRSSAPRGGQISTRSVRKVLGEIRRTDPPTAPADDVHISADSEPAARLRWADWSSLAAAVCVMIPPEIRSAPSPLRLTATFHLLSAALTTNWSLWSSEAFRCVEISLLIITLKVILRANKHRRKLRSKSRSSNTLIASITWSHLCSLPAVKCVPAGHRTQSDDEPITSKQKQHQKKAPDWLLWSRKWTQNWMLLRNRCSEKVRRLFKNVFWWRNVY